MSDILSPGEQAEFAAMTDRLIQNAMAYESAVTSSNAHGREADSFELKRDSGGIVGLGGLCLAGCAEVTSRITLEQSEMFGRAVEQIEMWGCIGGVLGLAVYAVGFARARHHRQQAKRYLDTPPTPLGPE